MAEFQPPEVSIGDEVLFHADPRNHNNPCLGFVCSNPGRSTLTLLVFAEQTGWAFRQSVRHKDDPGLLENPQWQQWGCWEFTKKQALLKKLETLQPQITTMLARNQK